MFARLFKPKISSAQIERVFFTANLALNIGYQAVLFGKEGGPPKKNFAADPKSVPLSLATRRIR